MDCPFCSIAVGKLRADIVAETKSLVSFRDINPKAPMHLLVIPRRHIATLNDLGDKDGALIGEMFIMARDLARDQKIDRSGWRTVFNTNADAAQSVFHIHLHVLGGRAMTWPPG